MLRFYFNGTRETGTSLGVPKNKTKLYDRSGGEIGKWYGDNVFGGSNLEVTRYESVRWRWPASSLQYTTLHIDRYVLLSTYCGVAALADDLSENIVFWVAFRHWYHVGHRVGGQRLTTVDLRHLRRLRGGLSRRRRRRRRRRLHSRRWRHDNDLLRRLEVERGSRRFSCCYLWKNKKKRRR